MGEYATYNHRSVKIGTCEDMYYLRFDQRYSVHAEQGSLEVMDPQALAVIRFRFPWPDEDGVAPGDFKDYDRSLRVEGVTIPAGVNHYSVQFKAEPGYLFSIPCPEGPGPHPVTVHKNGWKGDVLLRQQAVRGGKLVSIFGCGGCGGAFRVEDLEDLREMLADLRKPSPGGHVSDFHRQVADRIEMGYQYTDAAATPAV